MQIIDLQMIEKNIVKDQDLDTDVYCKHSDFHVQSQFRSLFII